MIRYSATAGLAALLAGAGLCGPAVAADVTGRIYGDEMNRPGVALPVQGPTAMPVQDGRVVLPENGVVTVPQAGRIVVQGNGQLAVPQSIPQPTPQMAPQPAPLTGPQDNSVELNYGQPSHTPIQMTRTPSVWVHPTRGFSMPIPAGVAVAHRGKEMNMAIRSPNGYLINLQTGDRNDSIPLPDMLGRLEANYLNDRGPWQQKLRQEETRLAGLPAVEAIYQGHRTTSRVVIARGAKTDFVLTFVSPGDLFIEHSRVFDWVIANFKAGPMDMEGAAAQTAQARPAPPANVPLRAADSVAAQASGRPDAGPGAAPPPNMHRFTEPGYGFLMDYPKDWIVEKPTAFTASFSGPKGTPAYDAVVSIQNVNPAGAHSGNESATIAAADLLKSLEKGTRGLTVLGEGNLAESPGSQFIARYDYSGRTYRKWAVVVPRPEGTIAHIWSFTAPDKEFDSYRPMAESMLRSWTLTQ